MGAVFHQKWLKKLLQEKWSERNGWKCQAKIIKFWVRQIESQCLWCYMRRGREECDGHDGGYVRLGGREDVENRHWQAWDKLWLWVLFCKQWEAPKCFWVERWCICSGNYGRAETEIVSPRCPCGSCFKSSGKIKHRLELCQWPTNRVKTMNRL